MLNPEGPLAGTDPAPAFAALGDVTRLELLSRLRDGQARSITELGHGLSLTRQGITKHLRVLEGAGIVRSSRVGRETRFKYRPAALDPAKSFLDRVSKEWDDALSRLKSLVEG